MDEIKRRLLMNVLKLIDLGLGIVAFSATSTLVVYPRESVSLARFLTMRITVSNYVLFAAFLLAWHVIFSMCDLYVSHRMSTLQAEVLDAFKATTLSTALLIFAGAFFSIPVLTPLFCIVFWLISFGLVSASRLVLRTIASEVRRRGRNLRFLLILGTNSRAMEFARKIENSPERGYRILGFVDSDWSQFPAFESSGFRLACNYAELPEFLRKHVVDEVAMYLPLRSFHGYSSEVAALCQQHGIILRFDSDIFGLKTPRWKAEGFDDAYYVAAGVPDAWSMLGKRALDLLISSFLLILLAPLFAIVALWIKFSNGGPVFFTQERVGLNKRIFRIYKFCTMVSDAEKMMTQLEKHNEMTGPVFKIKNDPRITPAGRFLRRTSIDELPQLLNVFKGDMSLVGPRPLPVRDYQGFQEDWQRRRFSARPGITCLWQVNGRNSLTFEQWMKLDIQYLDERSFWLDLKILARTIPAVLKGSGAA
jgi:exopolysaccharide biosynthesis polyprenyl glycosylphosphotransferase